MHKLKQLFYETPEAETVELKAEALICESKPGEGTLGDYSDEDFIW